MGTEKSNERVLSDETKTSDLDKAAVIGSAYADFKLLSMIDFVFLLRNRTTSELVRDFPRNFNNPVWKGNVSESVKDFLAIDAIQWKLTGEYAKFCRTELNKNQFDQSNPTDCLFKGNWKYKREKITGFDVVYDDDFHINLDTLECWQWVEGGTMDFHLVGNTIGQLAEIAKGIKLTDVAIKRIFGHCL